MTAYRLPDWLGGHAVHVHDDDESGNPEFCVAVLPDPADPDGEAVGLTLQRRFLVEVKLPTAEDHLRALRAEIEAMRDMASKHEDATRHDERGHVHGWYRRRLSSVLCDPAMGAQS